MTRFSLSGLRMIRIGIQWFLNQTGPTATSHIESGGFVRSRPGVEHPDIMWHFMPSEVCEHGQKAPTNEAFQVRSPVQSQKGPSKRGESGNYLMNA